MINIFVSAHGEPVLKVACIGNSVTVGYGHKLPAETSYPGVLQKKLGAGYYVKNFGHSGATLLRRGHNPYYKTREFLQALDFVPDMAIIDLGLNDTDPRNWPNFRDEFAADYSWLIDTLRRVNPRVRIFICSLTPVWPDHPRFQSGTRDWFRQIQLLIPQIAKANKTALIDLHDDLYKRPDLFVDALHPGEEGAAIIAKTIYSRLSGDYGGLQLPQFFSSHMVMQRDKPIKFYGVADRKEKIQVIFNGRQLNTVANDEGKWMITFPARPAGGPYTATIVSPAKKIELEDVLIGDLWFCSGQSNMAFPLRASSKYHEEMLSAHNNPDLRLLQMKAVAETNNASWDKETLATINKLEYFNGQWERNDSNKAKDFSAVAYYFASRIKKEINVPVGLIQVAVGGSPTESWIDRTSLEDDPRLVNELINWRKSDFYQPWCRERADTNLALSAHQRQRHPYDPSYNFEAGISQFTDFPIKGVIWYQGESNAHNTELHETLFPLLVKSWRSNWGYEFPFYYVQLSSLNRASWTFFRFSQLEMQKRIPNSGIAVSSDLGDSTDVHPRRKKEVGLRLARLALHFAYGKKSIVPNGPLPLKAIQRSNQVIVTFEYADKLKTADGRPLRGFVLGDARGIQKKATAFIRDKEVIIPFEPNEKPVELFYAWEPYTDANLVNDTGLPASTFKLKIH